MDSPAASQSRISKQFSLGSIRRSAAAKLISFRRQTSLEPRLSRRFTFGRQSSLDPNRRSPQQLPDEALAVPENLDSTMQLLFLACRGDVNGIEDLLEDGVDVNNIDLDGRTALHIASCEGQVEVVKLLLRYRANIDARDRWGSTAASDAKYYGNVEIYNILKARGAKIPKTRKTPMEVSNPREIPEYELNPIELQFRRGEDIIKGAYQVAKWNGTKVSVRILDKDSYADPAIINSFKEELTLLQKVRHPNVVQFVGAVTQNMPMMIVVEFHPKGDLASYIQRKGRLQIHKSLKFALDIARGMNYLHECKPDPIIHCDLKPKNILLDDGGQLKIAGFGLIKLSKLSPDKVKLAHPIESSSIYMAPEIYKDELFDKCVDTFSFGLILYEMIEGVPAFHPKAHEEAANLICLEGKRPQLKSKSRYPTDLKELIEACWDASAASRPTFLEITVRLEKLYANCAKQGRWLDSFKLRCKYEILGGSEDSNPSLLST